MVMKDKLVKTNHKPIYYTARKLAVAIVAGVSFACAVFIPTYIFATSQKGNSAIHAEETSGEEIQNTESESTESYEQYQESDQEQSDQ